MRSLPPLLSLPHRTPLLPSLPLPSPLISVPLIGLPSLSPLFSHFTRIVKKEKKQKKKYPARASLTFPRIR